MNPIVFAIRRPVTTMMLVGVLIGGGVLASNTMRSDIVSLHNAPKMNVYLDYIGTHAKQITGQVVSRVQSYFRKHDDEAAHHEEQTIVVTSPMAKDVILTQDYVCQIRSQRHIDVCALEDGYLKPIKITEGQAVKEGEVLFEILTPLYKARWEAEVAERDLAQLELNNTKRLANNQGVSQNEVKLFEAKLARAQAKADLAKAELDFTSVKAPFDGIINRLKVQQGSLVKEGDILTTLSDNSVMWVYFNVPEAQYLEYMASSQQEKQDRRIEVKLANGNIFPHPGKLDPEHHIGAIEGQFNNENGNLAFRADFPNPDRLLRHGQTGTILIHRTLKNAIVIPQRATFEILDKRYVWVVGEDDVAHQTLITIKHELEDIFIIDSGLGVNDKIVLEGVRQIADGGKVEDYESRKPEEALTKQKFRAE